MVASACARMMPGLASKPPQLPEWWPPSRKVSLRLKLSVPRVPPKMVGRRWSSRGPVRADQGIGLERRLVGLAEIGQARRAGLLAGLDQDGRVEAEVAALLQHAGKGCDVDGVLALVVGGAAAVHAVALDHDLPRRQALPPLLLLAADHVAMAVGQHGGLGGVLDPPRDQERAVFGCAGWAARCSRSRAFPAIRSSRPRRTAAAPASNPAPGWWSESPPAAAARPESRRRRNTSPRARWRRRVCRS